jgi:hypothetical protein
MKNVNSVNRVKFILLALPLLGLVNLASLQAQDLVAPTGHWATQSIQELTKRGILQSKQAPESKQNSGEKPKRKPPKGTSVDGDKPVTRYEMVVTLWRFVQYMEAADKQKKGKLSVQIAPAEASKMLVAGGYLPKNHALVQGDASKVTTKQFTEAMALVLSRIQEKKVPISPGAIQGDVNKPNDRGNHDD